MNVADGQFAAVDAMTHLVRSMFCHVMSSPGKGGGGGGGRLAALQFVFAGMVANKHKRQNKHVVSNKNKRSFRTHGRFPFLSKVVLANWLVGGGPRGSKRLGRFQGEVAGLGKYALGFFCLAASASNSM